MLIIIINIVFILHTLFYCTDIDEVDSRQNNELNLNSINFFKISMNDVVNFMYTLA